MSKRLRRAVAAFAFLSCVAAGAAEASARGRASASEYAGLPAWVKAVAIVKRDRKASTSYIQRRLQIGYNRAASLMERMEQEGIVGPANHAGKREFLVAEEEGNF